MTWIVASNNSFEATASQPLNSSVRCPGIPMNSLLGVVLVVMGLAVIVYGDKNVKKNGGAVLKTFSMPRLNAIVLKWAVGILLIWFGLGFIFSGLKL